MELPYKKLKIWQRSMDIAIYIYYITRDFPKEESYGLTSQIRRSAISIPSNIAEGSQRSSEKDFAHFVLIAKSSLAEMETQLLLAQRLQYLKATSEDIEKIFKEIIEIDKMLYAFHKKLISNR